MSSRADVRRELATACVTSLDTVDQRCVAPCVPDRAARPLATRQTVWMLRRAFHGAFDGATGAEVVETLTGLAGRIAGRRESIRASVLAWTRLLDELTTIAQRKFGAGADRGVHKKDAVKAALVHYARDAGIEMVGVPDFIEPFLYEAIADVAVETIYRISRHQDGWDKHIGKWVRLRVARKRVAGVVVWLARRLAKVAWWIVLRQNPLVPELKAAVAKVAARAPADRELLAGSLRATFAALAWIGAHRREVMALLDAVIVAIREAEFQFENGADKRGYARELLFEFLLQEGIIAPSGFGRAMIEAVIDLVIDAVVDLFHHHNVFTRRRTVLALAAPAA